jgi:hypothetical protein
MGSDLSKFITSFLLSLQVSGFCMDGLGYSAWIQVSAWMDWDILDCNQTRHYVNHRLSTLDDYFLIVQEKKDPTKLSTRQNAFFLFSKINCG